MGRVTCPRIASRSNAHHGRRSCKIEIIPLVYDSSVPLLQARPFFFRRSLYTGVVTINNDLRRLFQLSALCFCPFCKSASIISIFCSTKAGISNSQYVHKGYGDGTTVSTATCRAIGGSVLLVCELFVFGHSLLKCPSLPQFQHGAAASCLA